MDNSWTVVVIVWLVGAAGLCPRDCDCTSDTRGRRQVSCSRGGLSGALPLSSIDPHIQVIKISAPEDNENSLTIGPIFQQFQHLEELHILRSNIPAIGKHSFWGVPTLRILDLSYNNISQVVDNNFRGLLHLTELYLNDNRIESMVSGTFHHLTELRILSLSKNRIRNLSPRLFLSLAKLHKLDLSYNYIEYLDPAVFKDVSELKSFRCQGCGLRNMNAHVFSLLSGLNHLDLSRNQFKYLSNDILRDLKKLESLNLNDNHFPVILENTFCSQWKLKSLYLSRNRLAKLTTDGFYNLTSLVELDLSYNKLRKLEPQSFHSMANTLRIITVSGNNLLLNEFTNVLQVINKLKELSIADMPQTIPSNLLSGLDNLRFLNLSGNGLMTLAVQIIAPVYKLMELDLSRNKFHGLDEKIVTRLENIPMLHLDDNPWACDLCHITPMLSRVNGSSQLGRAVCSIPVNLRGRPIGSLGPQALGWCGSGLEYKEEGIAGMALTHNTQLGLIAAGAAVALLVVTIAAVVAGIVYNRHRTSFFYSESTDKSPDEEDVIFKKNGPLTPEIKIKKVSIATIDEITKDPELAEPKS